MIIHKFDIEFMRQFCNYWNIHWTHRNQVMVIHKDYQIKNSQQSSNTFNISSSLIQNRIILTFLLLLYGIELLIQNLYNIFLHIKKKSNNKIYTCYFEFNHFLDIIIISFYIYDLHQIVRLKTTTKVILHYLE